ncbi:MAG TPA: hypothetical protein VFO56_09765, partial [Gaiellaceae bacterium]|nr:hypothetical protein [Gaiellaceae bacterium]
RVLGVRCRTAVRRRMASRGVAAKGALRKLWASLNRWFHWIALVGVVIGLVIAVKSQWAAITELDWEGSWKTLLLSAVCFSAAPLAQAVTFWIILRLLNARAPFGEAMVIWAHSYVLRYAPSGALAVVYRVRERERVAATREQVLAAEAYEHLGSLAAAACAFRRSPAGGARCACSRKWSQAIRRAADDGAAPESNRPRRGLHDGTATRWFASARGPGGGSPRGRLRQGTSTRTPGPETRIGMAARG